MLSFTINEFLSLKLENGRSNVYVKGRRFSQCMYLLLNIPVSKVDRYEEIDSIDKAAEDLNHGMHGRSLSYHITPKKEFLAHCSNIQAWVENNYDTRILHRNIAFPLLRELTEAGDIKARRVFKDEIASRFASGHLPVMLYLLQGGYLQVLNREELATLMNELDMSKFYDQRIEMLFPIIHQLTRLGHYNSKEIIKDQIRHRFEDGNARDINHLIRWRFYRYFTPEEQKELFNKININHLLFQRASQSLPLLKRLERLGHNKASKMIERKIITSFQEKRIYDIRFIIKRRFLHRLPHSRLEGLFDEFILKLIFDPSDRNSFSCLKNLPDYIINSERAFKFITTALAETFYAYKRPAVIILIEHFFERGYDLIEKTVKQNQKKINNAVIEALLNKDCKESDELLKYIDWSRYWRKVFLMLDDKRISVKVAHRILLKNDFIVTDTRKNYTIYEFCSHKAYKDLSARIDKFNENQLVEFNIIERALIRDARIDIPSLPLLDVNYGSNKKFSIMLHFTNYIKEIIFTNRNYYRYYYNRSGRTQNLADVLKKRNVLLEEALERKPQVIRAFYSEFIKFKKNLEKYHHDCKTLKTSIKKYLASTPQLSLIKDLHIEYKEKTIETFRKVYPSTFKPSYDEKTNTLILYEAHKWGKFHADSNIKIHESGVVLIFVNTFVNYSKRHNYHNAQVYFFFPKLKRFYTRKANIVRNIKNISNWDISITNLFGYEFLKS